MCVWSAIITLEKEVWYMLQSNVTSNIIVTKFLTRFGLASVSLFVASTSLSDSMTAQSSPSHPSAESALTLTSSLDFGESGLRSVWSCDTSGDWIVGASGGGGVTGEGGVASGGGVSSSSIQSRGEYHRTKSSSKHSGFAAYTRE